VTVIWLYTALHMVLRYIGREFHQSIYMYSHISIKRFISLQKINKSWH